MDWTQQRINRTVFSAAAFALPVVGLVRAALSPSGSTPTLIIGVIFAIYGLVFALLFFPTFIEATRNCDRVNRGLLVLVGSMAISHVVAIGGASATESNAWLFAYPAVATASLLLLHNTSLCKDANGEQPIRRTG